MRYKHYHGKDRMTLQAALRDRGFRSTEGRLELLAFLKRARKPLSVAEISSRLQGELDQVNVYRALEALTRKGLLVRSDLRQGGARYEYTHSHHHHLVCDDCGLTEDVGVCVGKDVEKAVLENSRTFRQVNTHALEFFGLCRACTTSS